MPDSLRMAGALVPGHTHGEEDLLDVSHDSLVGVGADQHHPQSHGQGDHAGVIGEVPFQAVVLLDDTATGTNKGRWRVSPPAGAGTVTVFKHRAVNGADANTNTTTQMVFDVNLNGVSKGTVGIASGAASGDADVSDYTLSDGDRITIDKDSGNDEGTVHQVILIGKQQVVASIAS
jgi:hypothetical protein